MPLLNEPSIRGGVTQQPGLMAQLQARQQQQELLNLEKRNIESQIGLRGAQEKAALTPRQQAPESGVQPTCKIESWCVTATP